MRTMPTGTTSISTAPITIEPMEAKYSRAVGGLLAEAFQGKFQNRIRLKEAELAECFELLLQHAPADPYTQACMYQPVTRMPVSYTGSGPSTRKPGRHVIPCTYCSMS